MATRRNRRVSHISPDGSKRIVSADTLTKPNAREAKSMNGQKEIKRIVFADTLTKPNVSEAKSKKGSQKELPKSASYCPCHLLRNARRSAVKVLRIVRARMARKFCFVSRKDSSKDDRDSAHQKIAPARDSHQSEAVEDCIAFMNSSSRKYE